METGGGIRLMDVWVGVRDPRQAKKVEHDLVEMLVVAVCAVLSGADGFVEIEVWAKEKLDWLRQYLKLEHGIPCHDTFGRVFAAIDPEEFGAAFLRWVGQVVPMLSREEVVAIDGKTSRRSGKAGATPLHLVSAFAAEP
ncbi:MAG: ISAs1 family transposase [Candidatus Accumulibacter similis]|nr:MAG: ISAs1 family transposase [Candidatus Accumulibacter similis]